MPNARASDATDPAAMFSLRDRVVVLTGASAGLGQHFARVLHAAGAHVILAARRLGRLEALAEELPGAHPVACDLERPDDMEHLVDEAHRQFGPVDVLVNGAGLAVWGPPPQEEPREALEQALAVNLLAPFRLAQLVFPDMAERGAGSIVNVSSINALVGIGRVSNVGYAASKGGLAALTRELAVQWGRHGIRVNSLVPGFFESEMTAPMYEDPALADRLLRNLLLPRHGTPADCGGALLFLASDASSYMTGQTVVVDGGWTAR